MTKHRSTAAEDEGDAAIHRSELIVNMGPATVRTVSIEWAHIGMGVDGIFTLRAARQEKKHYGGSIFPIDGIWHASVAGNVRRTFRTVEEARTWCEAVIRELGPIVDRNSWDERRRICNIGESMGGTFVP